MSTLQIEHDDRGNFRLAVIDTVAVRSEWAPYDQHLEFEGYIVLSQYWGDKERILKIEKEVSMKNVAVVQVCRECNKPSGWNGETFPSTTCEHMKAKWPTLIAPDEDGPIV